MKRHLLAFLSFLAISSGTLTSTSAISAPAEDKVQLSSFLNNATEKLVEDIWLKDAEYKEYIDFFGKVPSHDTGEADLNGDGIKEIFVRHIDDLYKFCADDAYNCRAHVYMVTDKGIKEIARFMAGADIIVTDNKTNGFYDIMTQDKNRRLVTYSWNGSAYVQQ